MRGAFPFPLTTVHHPLLTHRSPLSQYKRFRATIPGIDRYVVKWHPLMSPYVAFIYLCVRIAFGSSDDLDFDIPLVKIQQIAKGCVVSTEKLQAISAHLGVNFKKHVPRFFKLKKKGESETVLKCHGEIHSKLTITPAR